MPFKWQNFSNIIDHKHKCCGIHNSGALCQGDTDSTVSLENTDSLPVCCNGTCSIHSISHYQHLSPVLHTITQQTERYFQRQRKSNFKRTVDYNYFYTIKGISNQLKGSLLYLTFLFLFHLTDGIIKDINMLMRTYISAIKALQLTMWHERLVGSHVCCMSCRLQKQLCSHGPVPHRCSMSR